MGKYDNQ